MKIAIYSTHVFETPYIKMAFENKHELVFIDKELGRETIEMSKTCEAVLIFTSDNVDTAILEYFSSNGIKYILLRSAGFDHINVKEAKQFGIRVANVPAYSPYAVAEHAATLLLALNRKLVLSQKQMQLNDFRLDNLTGFDIHGKTVGIIGLGKIGKVFATIMNGFGCKLLCYDPHATQYGQQQDMNLKFVELKELCECSDIISIHCPLNKSTEHLLNANTFSWMKKGMYLINTARGPIIRTIDLIAALDDGTIAAAGLDVYEFEKGIFFNDCRKQPPHDALFEKLRSYDNVLITGHQAFLTKTALKNIAYTCAYNLACFEQNVVCRNELL